MINHFSLDIDLVGAAVLPIHIDCQQQPYELSASLIVLVLMRCRGNTVQVGIKRRSDANIRRGIARQKYRKNNLVLNSPSK